MIPTRLTAIVLGAIGAVFLISAGSTPAQACQNFVGSVCVDKAPKKKAVKKKRTTTRSKPAVRAPAPAKPAPSKSANGCITTKYRYTGLTDVTAGHESWISVRNSCSESVTAFLQLNTCLAGSNPKFSASGRRDGRMQVTIPPNGRKRLMVNHQKRQLSRGEPVAGVYRFANQGGSFPKPPC